MWRGQTRSVWPVRNCRTANGRDFSIPAGQASRRGRGRPDGSKLSWLPTREQRPPSCCRPAWRSPPWQGRGGESPEGTVRRIFLVRSSLAASSMPMRGNLSRQEPGAARGPVSMAPIYGSVGLFAPGRREFRAPGPGFGRIRLFAHAKKCFDRRALTPYKGDAWMFQALILVGPS